MSLQSALVKLGTRGRMDMLGAVVIQRSMGTH